MSFHLDFSEKSLKDIESFRKTGDKVIVKKLYALFLDISNNPFSGIGNPEKLKHELSGLWSRRINKEHRLVYEVEIEDEIVVIISAKGHYINV